ncbi:MAG: protein translocase subunit SecD [Planctomycetota bacterium]|nr:protein translocase subunit SecD [Planctomycetota bacterium]
MSSFNSRFIRTCAAIVVLGSGLLLTGCGRNDPIGELRSLGCEIKKEGFDIASINFPPQTTDEDLKNLVGRKMKKVEQIDLANTKITDEGLKYLSGLKSLQILNLSRTDITDAGLKQLTDLPRLRSLSIGDTKVTDASVGALKGLPSLQLLDVSRMPEPVAPDPRSLGDAVRLGIDLAGGANIVFQVDQAKTEKEITDEVMNQMVGAIIKRVNPSGTEEVTVRRVGFDRVEIIIPGVDQQHTQAVINKVTRLGSLEFAILANSNDHEDFIAEATKLTGKNTEVRRGGRVVAGWRQVGVRDGIPRDVSDYPESRVVSRPVSGSDVPGLREFLVVFEPLEKRVTGRFLVRTSPDKDQSGEPVVSFTFNGEGGRRFFNLTSRNAPSGEGFHRRLAILLDERIQSAPRVNEPISNRGQISGGFTIDEVNELVNVLNAGALEVPLKPTPVRHLQVSPTLGADVKRKGIYAIIIASVAVVGFMLVYYMFAGLVANMCLCLNLLLVMGTMTFINATFTLPGLAGLVLTIGMAVDANVLIFERMREELARGSSMRMSIQNGFARAFTTIVDANVTTLLTAVVLYLIGTDQVRGFAVTLFIGIVMSMFTALYFGRLLFDLAERHGMIKNLKMLSVVGKTNWQFVAKQRFAAIVSSLVIAVGLLALAVRGSALLDIDFTGGMMVTMSFVEPVKQDDVEQGLETAFKDDGVAVEKLTFEGDPETDEGSGLRFQMRTTRRDADNDLEGSESRATVTSLINSAFENSKLKLLKVTMTAGSPQALKLPDDDDESTKKDEENSDAIAAGFDPSFDGGHQVLLSFRAADAENRTLDKLAIQTARDLFSDSVLRLRGEDGSAKYQETTSLFEIEGPEKEATGRFESMTLFATKDMPVEDLSAALASMQAGMASSPLFVSVNSFDSQVANEMKVSAVMAMLASLLAIVAYIWLRFQRVTFGLAAVAALVHDVLVVLGLVALASWFCAATGLEILGLVEFKINLPMIAAFLTIVGYSLNDTIVVFDRIREVRGKNPKLTPEMVDTSLNQTLSRTILTSLTTFLVVGILYAIGGEGIHGFAYCLVLGVIVGTYSSIFVASPVLLWLMNRESDVSTQRNQMLAKGAAATMS